jgi:hypothetical protein
MLGVVTAWERRYSDFSTVLFNSDLDKGILPVKANSRLIGRMSLPWHQFADIKRFAGDDLFGVKAKVQSGERAESVWGKVAADLAEDLYLKYLANAPGTSILVVGFTEPAREDRSLEDMAKDIEQAAAVWFWPSLTGKTKDLEVQVEIIDGGQEVYKTSVKPHEGLAPFMEALEHYRTNNLKPELKNPGDVAARPIPVEIPAQVDGTEPEFEAEATLVVRLAPPDMSGEELQRCNSVAFFRGFGMVVDYIKLERLSLTARPYHALLICGKARQPGNTPEDNALDQFLRAAEPAEHRTWKSTPRLKETYRQGYAKALDRMYREVRQKLKELVGEQAAGGTQGPQILMKKFPIGPSAGGGGEKQPFHYQQLKATLNKKGEWEFKGKVRAETKIENGWEVQIDVKFAEEGGGRGEGGMIMNGSLTHNGGTLSMHDGKATITLPATVKEVTFKGKTDPARHPIDAKMGTVELVIRGKALQ